MTKCRLFLLIVQLLCTSLVAAPFHHGSTFQRDGLQVVQADNLAKNVVSSVNESHFPRFILQQVSADELFQEIIIPLNSDLTRTRLSIHHKAIQPDEEPLILSPGKNDATSFQISASYHFSSTDFHSYLFRLKPF